MSSTKEKAEELCFKFQGDFKLNWTMSKRCALITVDEILSFGKKISLEILEYYSEVKNEIEKL
jgi:hypothetical protein